jgi:hypothetical protein
MRSNSLGGNRTLVPDGDVGWFQLLRNAAKVLFRFAIAVLHRGVEVIHASGDRPRDGTLLVGRIAPYHKSADCAAAEAQRAAFPCAQRPAIASLFLRLAGEIMQGRTAVTQPWCLPA